MLLCAALPPPPPHVFTRNSTPVRLLAAPKAP
jgi:hypothetical protein